MATTTPLTAEPCLGSYSANFTTNGIADGRGACTQCGRRYAIIPANTCGRWTRRDLPVIDYHYANAHLIDVPADDKTCAR